MNTKASGTRFDLQGAIDALPPEGGTISIPPGNYRLEDALRLRRRNARLTGAGADSTRIASVDPSAPVVTVEQDSCTIEGLHIGHAPGQAAIEIRPEGKDAEIRDVSIEGTPLEDI